MRRSGVLEIGMGGGEECGSDELRYARGSVHYYLPHPADIANTCSLLYQTKIQ
jgi:hypothetical protein